MYTVGHHTVGRTLILIAVLLVLLAVIWVLWSRRRPPPNQNNPPLSPRTTKSAPQWDALLRFRQRVAPTGLG
jgi:uncharacterized iron-regulated membrane protein